MFWGSKSAGMYSIGHLIKEASKNARTVLRSLIRIEITQPLTYFFLFQLRILHFPPSPTGNIQMEFIEPKLVFCHNDLSPQNIIYDPLTRNVSLIHLEFADFNFQGFEIARHFYTLSGSDMTKVGCADYVPAPEFQKRWCHHYLASYNNTSLGEVTFS